MVARKSQSISTNRGTFTLPEDYEARMANFYQVTFDLFSETLTLAFQREKETRKKTQKQGHRN